MARETLFETQEISGLAYIEGLGYAAQVSPAPFALTVGETYVIEVEGNEFTRTAYAFDAFAPGTIAVGNEYPVTGVPDGMPVIIGYQPDTDYMAFISITEVDSMTIGVYKEVEEKPVNIILRNPHGEEKEYPLRQMIEVDTTDGNTALYSKGEVLDSITIEPDFSAGDMTIDAPDGYLVKSAVIAKPANLKPENIAKDENVAGIVGTHEGGGGVFPFTFVSEATWLQVIYASTSLGGSKTFEVTLPAKAEVLSVTTNGNYISTKSSSAPNETTCNFYSVPPTSYSITETSNGKIVNYTTNTPDSTGYNARYRGVYVTYYVPGINMVTNELGTVDIIADGSVDEYPLNKMYTFVPRKIDLSASKITTLPQQFCFGAEGIEEIIFPETLADLSKNYAYYFYAQTIKVVDFSRCKKVIPLGKGGFSKFAGRIKVPAALYDEWIAAENWTAYASYIVAV